MTGTYGCITHRKPWNPNFLCAPQKSMTIRFVQYYDMKCPQSAGHFAQCNDPPRESLRLGVFWRTQFGFRGPNRYHNPSKGAPTWMRRVPAHPEAALPGALLPSSVSNASRVPHFASFPVVTRLLAQNIFIKRQRSFRWRPNWISSAPSSSRVRCAQDTLRMTVSFPILALGG